MFVLLIFIKLLHLIIFLKNKLFLLKLLLLLLLSVSQ